jgi:hypothetical protein
VSPLLALLALLLAGPAHATGAKLPGALPAGVDDHLRRLDSGEPAKRRLAIRALRTVVRAEVRRSADGQPDDLLRDEARMILTDLDARLAPRCTEGLAIPELTIPCADILRRLETTQALPALEQARATETRPRARRRLDRTITTLQGFAREQE